MWEAGLYSAIVPWILLLISSLWRYPAGLEELVKWGILKLTANDQLPTIQHGLVVGLIFGMSESVFYTLNAWSGGQWGAIGMRLITTVPMHIVTAGIIAFSMRHRRGGLGLVSAVLLHMSFNLLVGH